jgi:hypothetical protein
MNKSNTNAICIQNTSSASKHELRRDEFIYVDVNDGDDGNDGYTRKKKRARQTSMASKPCEIDSSPSKMTQDKLAGEDECPSLNKIPERSLSLCFESEIYSVLDNDWLSPSSVQSNKGRSIVQADHNITQYQFDFSSYSHGDNVMLNINSENNPYNSDTRIEMSMSNISNDNSIHTVELQLEFLRTLKKLYKSIQRTDESRNILQRQRFVYTHENAYNHHHHHHDHNHCSQSINYFTTRQWYETELYRKQFKQIIQNDCLHRTVF